MLNDTVPSMTYTTCLKASLRYLPLLLAMLLVAVGLTIAHTAPAHAVSNIQICNHSQSVDDILAYRISSPFQEAQINQGTCAWINDDGGAVRVDVDLGGHEADVDSWYKKKNSLPYTGCVNNEDESSDPYSGAGTKTTYRTFIGTNCG